MRSGALRGGKRRSEEHAGRRETKRERGAEIEREKGENNGGEKQRERDGFAMSGEKWLECPGKISSGPTKGKARETFVIANEFSNLQFPSQNPEISLCVSFSFLFCDYTAHLISEPLCRSFAPNCQHPLNPLPR